MSYAEMQECRRSQDFARAASRRIRDNTHRTPQRYLRKIYEIFLTPHPEIPPQAAVIYKIYQISRSRRIRDKNHRAPQRYLRKIYEILPAPHPEIPLQAEVIYKIYQISLAQRAGE